MRCRYEDDVIKLLEGEIEDEFIEEHIEACEICKRKIEQHIQRNNQERLDIVSNQLKEGLSDTENYAEEKNFKKYITKYKVGMTRTIVFIIIGMIIGWLSYYYNRNTFIIVKLFTGAPYKITEIIYNFIYEPPYMYVECAMTRFFPQSQLIGYLAERVTPVLIGATMYGSIGYFTGDKHIFTLKKYVKFALIWSIIIITWIGSMLVANEYCIKKSRRLEDINGFVITSASGGSGYYEDYNEDVYNKLVESLGDTRELKYIRLPDGIERSDKEVRVVIYMELGRVQITSVNYEKEIMIFDDGRVCKVSPQFAKLIKCYGDNNSIFLEETNREIISEESIIEYEEIKVED